LVIDKSAAKEPDVAAAGSLASPNQPSAESQQISILLADDTPANQKVIGSILRKRGHSVTIASNGREALEHVANAAFGAIIMDLQMPVMDGYQTTAAIRELERHSGRHTPIVALTAHSTERDRDACLKAGMDAYLPKPIDVGHLTAVVEAAATRCSSSQLEKIQQRIQQRGPHGANLSLHVIDVDATMKRLGGDEELFREFIEVFMEDAPRLLEMLSTAIPRQKWDVAVRAAHSLRGLAANFSATSVLELASALEQAAQNGEFAEASAAMEELEAAVSDVCSTLEALRDSPGNAAGH
jgi:CheY-like chemotaxis protein